MLIAHRRNIGTSGAAITVRNQHLERFGNRSQGGSNLCTLVADSKQKMTETV